MQESTRRFEDVLETLHHAKLRGRKATLLIGAGCSVTAGVPTGTALVRQIQQEFPCAARRATAPTAAAHLAELSLAEQRALIGRCLENTRINPAHLAIAHLIKRGFIDRVLTCNFDPLLPRACALAGEFPAIFSVPHLSLRELKELPEKAIFYVQGQGAVRSQPGARILRALLEEASQDRPWLVVGYRGTDETLFPHLAARRAFDNRLFWVGHEDTPPAEIVERKLLRPQKDAYWVPGFSADAFFVQLARHLGGFSPDFAERLLEHPQAILETLSPATEPEQLLSRALQGATPQPKELHPGFLAAQLREGNQLVERAQYLASYEADSLFETAYARFAGIVALAPEHDEALLYWGMALSEQAKLKTGTEAERLLGQASKKYEQAATLKPDEARITYLRGMTQSRRAQLTRGEPADLLLRDAQTLLAQAEESKPGMAAYFLACLCGSQGDIAGAEHWLQRCQSLDLLPAVGLLESNPAFRKLHPLPWFQALCAPSSSDTAPLVE